MSGSLSTPNSGSDLESRFDALRLMDQTSGKRDGHGLGATVHLQLSEDALQVDLHCFVGAADRLGDIVVAKASPDERQHLELPCREIVFGMLCQEGCHREGNDALAAPDAANRCDDVGQEHVLQQVTPCAGAE